MIINAIKTKKIRPSETTIESILSLHLPKLHENTIVVITSKIVSLCEGAYLRKTNQTKNELAIAQADMYISSDQSKYDVTLTIKNNQIIPSSGIDESNGDGNFIFWPKDPQASANSAREYLAKKYSLQNIGIIISDSKTTPLRWGTTGTSIAYSGFLPLNDCIGRPDVFGKLLVMTKVNVVDALATSAVLVMGEADEQTPLAVISDVPFVQFQGRNPTKEELDELRISLEDDVYSPILTSAGWQEGKK